jgi:hypothetical protein
MAAPAQDQHGVHVLVALQGGKLPAAISKYAAPVELRIGEQHLPRDRLEQSAPSSCRKSTPSQR